MRSLSIKHPLFFSDRKYNLSKILPYKYPSFIDSITFISSESKKLSFSLM